MHSVMWIKSCSYQVLQLICRSHGWICSQLAAHVMKKRRWFEMFYWKTWTCFTCRWLTQPCWTLRWGIMCHAFTQEFTVHCSFILAPTGCHFSPGKTAVSFTKPPPAAQPRRLNQSFNPFQTVKLKTTVSSVAEDQILPMHGHHLVPVAVICLMDLFFIHVFVFGPVHWLK